MGNTTSSMSTDVSGTTYDENPTSVKLSIRMPDMFADMMATENLVNPHYASVKARSDAFIAKMLKFDDKKAQKSKKADFTYLTAVWCPHASEERLFFMQLWQEWVFWFDDQFDEGHLSRDTFKAAEEITNILALFDDTQPLLTEESPGLHQLIQTVWLKYRETTSKEEQYLFKLHHRKYLLGLVQQVHWASQAQSPDFDPETYLQYRRNTIAVEVSLLLMQWTTELQDIPSYVMEHPAIAARRLVSTDIVLLDNDILSLQKEINDDVEHNLVARLVRQGRSIQEAVDEIGLMLDERYRIWNDAGPKVPSWGKEIDDKVAKLMEQYLRMAVGTLHWSYHTVRYFGNSGQRVKETGIMELVVKV